MRIVYARWTLFELPESFDDFHISCGLSDDSQGDGYFISDKGAKLTVKNVSPTTYVVELTAPAQGIEKHKGYWLSPSCPLEVEADKFGVREG